MTIFADDGSWRTDLTPYVNTGVTWAEVQKAFVFRSGAWIQFYGPGMGISLIGMYMGGRSGASVYTDAYMCTWATFTTATQVSANLPSAMYVPAGCGNYIYGVIFGGTQSYTLASQSAVAQICTWGPYTTVLNAGANLTVARFMPAGFGNSIGGIIAGGESFSSPNWTMYATADLCTWVTTVTAAQASANLTVARYNAGAAGIETIGVYIGGSTAGNWTAWTNVADVCTFATYTTAAAPTANFVGTTTPNVTGCGDRMVYGVYWRSNQTLLNAAELCAFSTLVTTLQPSANLVTNPTRFLTGALGDLTAGIIAGGFTTAGVVSADKCTWATMTTAAAAAANLPAAKFGQGTTQDGTI